MARVRGHYGVIPNSPNRPRVTLKPKPNTDLNPPASVDWYSAVPAASWGMLANGPDSTAGQGPNYEGCGDCTCAGAGHVVDQAAVYAQGDAAPVTSIEALAAYEAISGYNPVTGRNDNGAELQQVLQWWAKNPSAFAGYTPSGYAEIDVTNLPLVKTCIAEMGSLYSGFAVPAIFETQFDNGQPWDVPTGRSGSQIVGGHCVPLVGYDANYLYVITWGAVQPVTYAAFAKYWGSGSEGQGEAWVVVLPQSVETSGATFEGLDTTDANAQFQALTGSTESPFPVVTPPAPPAPPAPAGTVQALLADIAAGLATSISDAQATQAEIATGIAAAQAGIASINAWVAANPPSSGGGDVPPHVHGH